MSSKQFLYTASAEMTAAWSKIQEDTNAFRAEVGAWQDAHPGYTLGMVKHSFGTLGFKPFTCFAEVPEDKQRKVYRNGFGWEPYATKRGNEGRELLASAPNPPGPLRYGSEPWNLLEHSSPADGFAIRMSWPELEMLGGTLYVLSDREQTSAHLTPATKVDYYTAKAAAEVTS